MKYKILDDYTVRFNHPQTKNTILIRILESRYQGGNIPYNIGNLTEYSHVLDLYFDDISEYNEHALKYFTFFDEQMAATILDLVKQTKPQEIVVHCSKGCSRSPAVMLGIADYLDRDDITHEIKNQNTYFHPNQWVLSIFEQYKKRLVK